MQGNVRSQLLGAAATSQMLYGLWSSGCCGAQQTEGLFLSLQKGLQDVMAWRVLPLQEGVLLVGTALWPGTKYCQHAVVTP